MAQEFSFNVIIIGDTGVGKSSIRLQLTENRFETSHDPTTGVDYGSKIVEVNGKKIKLHIWDAAKDESNIAVLTSYMYGAAAVLIVYDVTKKKSFVDLGRCLNYTRLKAKPNIVIMLIGNKSDLETRREVTKEDGKAFAKEHGLIFMETSAKTAANVEDAFINTAKEIYEKVQKGVLSINKQELIDITNPEEVITENVSRYFPENQILSPKTTLRCFSKRITLNTNDLKIVLKEMEEFSNSETTELVVLEIDNHRLGSIQISDIFEHILCVLNVEDTQYIRGKMGTSIEKCFAFISSVKDAKELFMFKGTETSEIVPIIVSAFNCNLENLMPSCASCINTVMTSFFCGNCLGFLCSKCKEAHEEVRCLRAHKVELKERPKTPGKEYCKKQNHEDIELHDCLGCKGKVCHVCHLNLEISEKCPEKIFVKYASRESSPGEKQSSSPESFETDIVSLKRKLQEKNSENEVLKKKIRQMETVINRNQLQHKLKDLELQDKVDESKK